MNEEVFNNISKAITKTSNDSTKVIKIYEDNQEELIKEIEKSNKFVANYMVKEKEITKLKEEFMNKLNNVKERIERIKESIKKTNEETEKKKVKII